MNWFYALNGQQAGPVDDAELDRLVQTGTINGTTLVWCNGMAQWQPYAEARQSLPALAGTAVGAGVPFAGGVGAGQAQCSQCGQVLPSDEIVRVDKYNVCAACKPLLLQKLREGISPAGAFGLANYGGFGVRLRAAILDFLILIPFYLVFGLALYFLTGLRHINFSDPQALAQLRMFRVYLPYNLPALAILSCYSAFCVSRFGGTPGKRLSKLRVVHGAAGGRVSFGRALCRYLAKVLFGFIPFIGFIYRLADALFIGIDGEKRALHDMMCDTRVVSEQP